MHAQQEMPAAGSENYWCAFLDNLTVACALGIYLTFLQASFGDSRMQICISAYPVRRQCLWLQGSECRALSPNDEPPHHAHEPGRYKGLGSSVIPTAQYQDPAAIMCLSQVSSFGG